MQRKSFAKLLSSVLLNGLAANFICLFITFAITIAINSFWINVVFSLLCFVIFYSLLFSVAYKDGEREKTMLKLGRITSLLPLRWVKIGAAAAGIFSIPAVFLFFAKLFGAEFNFLPIYKILCGSTFPFSNLLHEGTFIQMPLYVPVILVLYYAITPIVCHIGFRAGLQGINILDNIMYEKSKKK